MQRTSIGHSVSVSKARNAPCSDVRARLLPHVEGDARAWLLRATEPLQG